MTSARERTKVVLLVPGGPKRIADRACFLAIGWLSGSNLSLHSCVRTGLMNMLQSSSETGTLMAPQVLPRSAIVSSAFAELCRVRGAFRLLNASSRLNIPINLLSACAYERTLAVAQLSGEVTFVLWPEHHPISLLPGE